MVYGQKACAQNEARICRSDNDCIERDLNTNAVIQDFGDCSIQACDTLFISKNDIQDELVACPRIDPEIGCVGLHEVGGGLDTFTTALHCDNDPSKGCAADADCGGGKCGY